MGRFAMRFWDQAEARRLIATAAPGATDAEWYGWWVGWHARNPLVFV